ncbi:MAG: hypothetical protein S4CHLAM81_01590 [Chlamydiales bacterium]|nr:hypothetical protein [Chlamydiales bacterium]MCH9634955.1 hypothetical protein [Chlamydiales bacterium]
MALFELGLSRFFDNLSVEASFSPRLTHKGLDVRLQTSPRRNLAETSAKVLIQYLLNQSSLKTLTLHMKRNMIAVNMKFL